MRILGVRLILPAMVYGAVGGSLIDMLAGFEGWPAARLGVVLGPVGFALAINWLERAEAEWRASTRVDVEAYRRAETLNRMRAARAQGELVRFRR
jgi:hypothetical protein